MFIFHLFSATVLAETLSYSENHEFSLSSCKLFQCYTARMLNAEMLTTGIFYSVLI